MSGLSRRLLALALLAAAGAIGAVGAEGAGEEAGEACGVCACGEDGAAVDCSGRRLTVLPKGFPGEMKHLNLSNNEFTTFPALQSLYTLESVDASGNLLTSLPADALRNLTQLHTLLLARNAFSAWRDINPNTLLLPAEKLLLLDLSDNDFQTFANLTDDEFLISPSLETLVLERCAIIAIQGQSPIGGLTNLTTLRLSGNHIHKWEKMASPTLENLDMSHCALNYIHHSELSYLPVLRSLDLSHNYRLLMSTSLGNLSSDSLKELDVSYSNIDRVAISWFPNLRTANLTGNMIRSINTNDFYNNTKLIVLDLSYNSIGSLQSNCFRGLISLKHLNLTANMISELSEDTFMRTVTLISLSLSRNYFTKLGHLQSGTLQSLDVSLCEIDTIDKDSLEGMWSLKTLNLSRNLLSYIPDSVSSDTLTTLDLSSNRLSIVNNNTFYMLPRLMTLLVAGNRFSDIWKRSIFSANRYLERVDLSDNTWRCECSDLEMFELYEFLTLEPSKLEEADHLVCHSPANVSGFTWQDACTSTWFPTTEASGNETIVLCFTVAAFGLACCALVVTLVRRLLHARLEVIRQERERQAEEARERLRRLRMQHEQQAQCNAPDPRDLISPPSYDEALLMPRPVSTHSLNDGEKPKRKRGGRRRAKSSGDLVDEVATRTDVERGEEEGGGEGGDGERRRERSRRRRCGSHELKELERSPRARRRRLSDADAEDAEDAGAGLEADAEVERLMTRTGRNGTHYVDVRESDF